MKDRYKLLKKTLQRLDVVKRSAKEIDSDIHCLNLTDLRRITNNVIVSMNVPQRNQMLDLAEKFFKQSGEGLKK